MTTRTAALPQPRTILAPLALAALTMLTMATSGAQAQDNHAAPRACVAGEPSVVVHVRGFKSNVGIVRAQLYGPEPASFLAKGQWKARIEKRRDDARVMHFCFPVAAPGRYAIAVRHDANDNGKSDWNDGGGFSRNPTLSIFDMKPKFEEAAVDVHNGPVEVDIDMQYRQGLSIKPWRE